MKATDRRGFLGAAVVGTLAASFPGTAAAGDEPLDGFKTWLADLELSGPYQNWARDNCGKTKGGTPQKPLAGTFLARWYAFRDAIVAGGTPAAPDMGTNWFGRALVDVGLLVFATVAVPPVQRVASLPMILNARTAPTGG